MHLQATMSLIHKQGARLRRYLITASAMTALAAQSALAIPQSQAGAGTGVTVRKRSCSSCASDSLRKAREKLLMKIDSLRWEIENRRLSDAEREKVSREMVKTLLAMESSEAMRASLVLSAVQVEAEMEAERAQPAVAFAFQTGYRMRGYLGVTFDGAMAEVARPSNERVIRFYQYPRIALVEPSSPAERAGILAGDTLLALNGDDVREHEISFTKLLVPRTRITMRVSREGSPKDVKVTVGETPEEYYSRQVAPAPPVASTPPSMSYSFPREVRVYGQTAPAVPTAPMPPMVWSFDGLAGARVETVNEGLGKAIGVPGGVLVIRVAPGTPAYRSGLRDGDVVLRARGQNVSSVRDLRRLVGDGDGEEGIKLVIVRERKQRDLTLRW